jgi:pre-mRNA-processing factor 19
LTTAAFHPDGHLFAAGGLDGEIKLYDVKSGANAANFGESGPIQALSFSENGTWLAAACRGSTSISIWDLRKSAQIKVLEAGSPIESIRWDYTGQFLAIASQTGLAVQQYSKTRKEWSELLRNATPAVVVEWGANAHRLVSLGLEGTITVLGSG